MNVSRSSNLLSSEGDVVQSRHHEPERHDSEQVEKQPWEAEVEKHQAAKELVPGGRKPTFEKFMAKLEADEREMIANERKRAKELLDEIEAKQERDPSFVPDGNAFALEVEKQSIELNSDERFRARQLGIEHECVERRGLSYGF